jgi:hypothetical protein
MRDAERFDDLLDAGNWPAEPCPVCTGDDDAHPCSEECEALIIKAKRTERIAGLFAQARRAARLAKTYRAEQGPGGSREILCLEVIDDCRIRIRMTRACAALDERRRSA